ncbi:hypothetical protein, conserved [Entamoeba dispar SAW760]|uniref:AIG1-type G domain-containing protein n=1 Tax=Entamoeba dispar (strain ATCC PRA-260 / SAW760) TaxID=370354 RepID=B0EV13_ENTDS|nr:uncharacterized protein EDI_036150 [Entamoeba dispar SAW760]EDR21629.1 hypothetical protein, conserved [Entamoeba dispar SAW760]|eukprot:EDR21629.1 hypothetical protein, conserved [Entamoeba dispar SAW760]
MSLPESKKAKILLIGDTGYGKSSLGNFILNKKNAFQVSNSPTPETKESHEVYGEGDRNDISVIDTPSFSDSSKMNEELLNEIARYALDKAGIQAIVIVMDFNNDEISHNLKTMIETMCFIFPFFDFWDHVCIVWTKCYYYTPKNRLKIHKKTKEDCYYPKLKSLIEEMTKKKEDIKPKMYYVDSQPDEDCDDNSRSEKAIKKLLEWVKRLESIKFGRELGLLGSEYKNIITEEKQRREDVKENEINTVPQIKPMRREIKIGYNGKITCSEWEIINDNTNETSKKNPSFGSFFTKYCTIM